VLVGQYAINTKAEQTLKHSACNECIRSLSSRSVKKMREKMDICK